MTRSGKIDNLVSRYIVTVKTWLWGMLLVLSVSLAACSSNQSPEQSTSLAEIARLEDVREPGAPRLSQFAASSDPVIAARAVRALARLQDPTALPAMESALRSPSSAVADEGAFALLTVGTEVICR